MAGIAASGSGGGVYSTGSISGNIDVNCDNVDDLISAGGDDVYLVSCDGTGAMIWA